MTREPEQLTLEANGLTFGALRWGEADAPLALCLHGYPDSAWSWRHLGPQLAAEGWRVVAPFTRGYAPTSLAPDDDYTIAALAADAVALAEVLDAGEGAALIGHDWGAEIATRVASTEPTAFAKYALLAVPPAHALRSAPKPRPMTAARQLRRSWYMVFQQLPAISERSLDRLIPRLWADWSPGYSAAEDVAHVFDAIGGPENRRAALNYYRQNLRPSGLKAMGQPPRRPLLYLHGRDDGCLDLDFVQAGFERLPPGSRAEVVGSAGHFLHLEQPERVNGLISDWLAAPG